MRLDYEELAECVDRLVGTKLTAEQVAENVAGVDHDKIENLETVERAAPACAACGVRGLGADMVEHPVTKERLHRVCV